MEQGRSVLYIGKLSKYERQGIGNIIKQQE